jgi:hypothetical protein
LCRQRLQLVEVEIQVSDGQRVIEDVVRYLLEGVLTEVQFIEPFLVYECVVR